MVGTIDETDITILRLLQHNSRLTNKEIADKINRSSTAVVQRIKRLEEDGFIVSYTAILNKDLIEKNLVAIVGVELKEQSNEALLGFARECTQFHEVMECYHVTGDYDYILKIVTKDLKEYQAFLVEKLSALPDIGGMRSFVVLKENKVETTFSLKTDKKSRKPSRSSH
ncbi:MAG: Lrp/AsnC family transcriptional regulator [Puia sp.]|nr:Lrp/AsnC family transcriptional regulator [Puia sp.]